MEKSDSPRIVTSKRKIKYRKSSWQIHNFEVWSGELLCRVAVLRLEGSLLLWVGTGQAVLGEIALAMPGQVDGQGVLSSSLLGAEVGAASLARQLALALKKPVYVLCGANFDRFTTPLVIKGLVAEIKIAQIFFDN